MRAGGLPLPFYCVFILSYFILMLRATLCVEVGLMNHNQPNLVHVCAGVGVAGGRNSGRCPVMARGEERRREG